MVDLDDGGAQDMAGRGQLDAATARQVRGRVEVDRPQGRDRALRVGDGVQRQRRLVTDSPCRFR